MSFSLRVVGLDHRPHRVGPRVSLQHDVECAVDVLARFHIDLHARSQVAGARAERVHVLRARAGDMSSPSWVSLIEMVAPSRSRSRAAKASQ